MKGTEISRSMQLEGGTLHKENEVNGKSWIGAGWRPCLGTLGLEEQRAPWIG